MINYTIESQQIDYEGTIEDLRDQFYDNVENVSDFFVEYDEDGNAVYEPEYTPIERESLRVEIIDRLAELEREIEGRLDELHSALSDVESLLDEVEGYRVDD